LLPPLLTPPVAKFSRGRFPHFRGAPFAEPLSVHFLKRQAVDEPQMLREKESRVNILVGVAYSTVYIPTTALNLSSANILLTAIDDKVFSSAQLRNPFSL
jgi:hypothetical protein